MFGAPHLSGSPSGPFNLGTLMRARAPSVERPRARTMHRRRRATNATNAKRSPAPPSPHLRQRVVPTPWFVHEVSHVERRLWLMRLFATPAARLVAAMRHPLAGAAANRAAPAGLQRLVDARRPVAFHLGFALQRPRALGVKTLRAMRVEREPAIVPTLARRERANGQGHVNTGVLRSQMTTTSPKGGFLLVRLPMPCPMCRNGRRLRRKRVVRIEPGRSR